MSAVMCSLQDEPLVPGQPRKRPLSIIEENDSDVDGDVKENTTTDDVTKTSSASEGGIVAANRKSTSKKGDGSKGRSLGNEHEGEKADPKKPRGINTRTPSSSSNSKLTSTTRSSGRNNGVSTELPRRGARVPSPTCYPSSPTISRSPRNMTKTSPVSPKPKLGQLNTGPSVQTTPKFPKRKDTSSPLSPTSSSLKDESKPLSQRTSRRSALTSEGQGQRPRSPQTTQSPKRTHTTAPSRVAKTRPSPLAGKATHDVTTSGASPSSEKKTQNNAVEGGRWNSPQSHSPSSGPGDGRGLERIREQAQQLKLSSSSSTNTTPSPSPSPKLGHRFHTLTDHPPQVQIHPSATKLQNPPAIIVSNPPRHSSPILSRSPLLSRVNLQNTNDNNVISDDNNSNERQDTPPHLSPSLPKREFHLSPTFVRRFPHSKVSSLFPRKPSIDSNCSISEESELELDQDNTSAVSNDSNINNNNNDSTFSASPQYSLSPFSPDFLQLQETAHRLRLSTRRPSVLQWRQKYMDSPGFPRTKPELNGDVVDERLTSDRKQRINDALEWLRNELHEMRSQDQHLARQLLSIRQDIHQLKLRRSTEEHEDLLDDFQCELEDLQEFSHVLDLQQPTLVNPLKHVGVTRLNLSARRFSAC